MALDPACDLCALTTGPDILWVIRSFECRDPAGWSWIFLIYLG